jgi:hypothetical protein
VASPLQRRVANSNWLTATEYSTYGPGQVHAGRLAQIYYGAIYRRSVKSENGFVLLFNAAAGVFYLHTLSAHTHASCCGSNKPPFVLTL